MSLLKNKRAAALSACGLMVCLAATEALSQTNTGRPGIDRPIRVGMFKGGAPGTYFWHTNIHTVHNVMAALLANPATAGLGDSLVIPPAGISFYSGKVRPNNAGTGECAGNGCTPTPEQVKEFIRALDTLDVIILHTIELGNVITEAVDRQKLADFWTTKGYVGIHKAVNTLGEWAPIDIINGARFRGHPAEQDATLRADSTFAHEPHWQYLNQGLFSNGTDTSFFEEWYFFTTSGADIRARPYLKPTVNLLEASLANPGSQTPMGDHPMSWYRALPTGGRTFYTAVGHRSQVWQTTRMFRRQLYNAILWAAKYDSVAQAVAVERGARHESFAPTMRLTTLPGKILIGITATESHTVDLSTPDGKRLAHRRGEATPTTHEFSGLKAGVYVVTVNTVTGRSVRLVTIGH